MTKEYVNYVTAVDWSSRCLSVVLRVYLLLVGGVQGLAMNLMDSDGLKSVMQSSFVCHQHVEVTLIKSNSIRAGGSHAGRTLLVAWWMCMHAL